MAFQDGVEYKPKPLAPPAASDGLSEADRAAAVVAANDVAAADEAAAAAAASGGGESEVGALFAGKSYDELRQARKALWGNKRKSRFVKKDALATNTAGPTEDEKLEAELAKAYGGSSCGLCEAAAP